MSVLVGPISGALAAGGVYYGFSHLMHTRTEQHKKDLRALSIRLVETPTLVHAPPPAATRIRHHPFTSELKSHWNHEIAKLFSGFHNLDKSAVEWGRRLLHTPATESISEATDKKNTKPSP